MTKKATDGETHGKAWWVQLQHQRAVSAGCSFYTHRPNTSYASLSTSRKAEAGSSNQIRPATVGTCHATPADAANSTSLGAFSGGSSGGARWHAAGAIRPGTSPKLPARIALRSTQASGALLPSAAMSRTIPPSRGNDWSPVHSRPATRNAADSTYVLMPAALTATAAESCAVESKAAMHSAREQASRPPRHKDNHAQQRPSSCFSNAHHLPPKVCCASDCVFPSAYAVAWYSTAYLCSTASAVDESAEFRTGAQHAMLTLVLQVR